MTAFTVQGIDHVVLRVVDVEGVIRFYQDVLGCAVERRKDDLGLIQLRAGRSLIDLVDVNGELGQKGGAAPGAEARNMDHFCLRIDPFDEAQIRAHLRAHGGGGTGDPLRGRGRRTVFLYPRPGGQHGGAQGTAGQLTASLNRFLSRLPNRPNTCRR